MDLRERNLDGAEEMMTNSKENTKRIWLQMNSSILYPKHFLTADTRRSALQLRQQKSRFKQ